MLIQLNLIPKISKFIASIVELVLITKKDQDFRNIYPNFILYVFLYLFFIFLLEDHLSNLK
jgi:hypothetical protein